MSDTAKEMLAGLVKEIAILLKQKPGIHRKVSVLHAKEKEIDERIEVLVRQANETKRMLVLYREFPFKLVTLRGEILALRRREESQDETVKSLKEVSTKRRELEAHLQRMCAHRLVIGYSGYSGSHEMDYDDAYSGNRTCVVCGLEEKEKHTRDQNQTPYYEVLASPSQLFSFQSSAPSYMQYADKTNTDVLVEYKGCERLYLGMDRKEFSKFDIWRPLSELREFFRGPLHFYGM
ncbi:MAG: hypothetical protein KGI50_03595 [Patescibacteria group bacterium]|nr:hypothetical protein [Patescibacteria group bacterium]MDE2438376.1 hypothetical protein [Patescibacteria group bacterium]